MLSRPGAPWEGLASSRRPFALALMLALALGSGACVGALTRGPHAGEVSALQPYQVRTVQRELRLRGHRLEPTGVWDEPTRAAVSEYQRSRGLPMTGLPDRATLFLLGVEPDPRFNCEVNSSVDCGPQGGP